MEKPLLFHEHLRRERLQRGWSQEDLAEQIGVDFKTVGRWEQGRSRPRPKHLKKIYHLFSKNAEEMGILEGDAEKRRNGKKSRDPVLQFPGSHFRSPNGTTSLNTGTQDLFDTKNVVDTPEETLLFQNDWNVTPQVSGFYGRKKELAQLQAWIVDEHCHIVTILGMGGVGKTTLSSVLAAQVRPSFKYMYWQSLHNAPPLEDILNRCIQVFSDHQHAYMPESIDDQMALFMQYLQNHRCLLVLDNAETLLQAGRQAGQYRDGYENYGTFFQRIGETDHRSCLLITSREKPEAIARMEGKTLPVRSYHLQGVELAVGQEILQDKGLSGSADQWATLMHLYSGNPLALKLVAETIQEVFRGNIARFLQEGETAFGNISTLLEQQFSRLSLQEQELLYWLAIERELVPLDQIRENLIHPLSHRVILETLTSLRRRSIIESREPDLFTLQPVIMEYVTAQLVERFVASVPEKSLEVWSNYALIKAGSQDYVRDSQTRLLLLPVVQRLLSLLGKEGVEQALKEMLARQRASNPYQNNYTAGNVLNLLISLQSNLRGADFSSLTIRQAYLQNAALPEVNFAHAHFIASIFANTSGNVHSVAFSPDGTLLAVGTATSDVWLYDVPGGTPLLTCQGHSDAVWSVAFSPDGQTLVSSSDDQTIRLWDTATGQCFRVIQGHENRVRSVAFSPDGNLLASASEDLTVRLWNPHSGACLRTLLGHSARIWSVAFSPDGRLLATGSTDQSVRLWDLTSGTCRAVLMGHTDWVLSVAFSPDGHLLASSGDDRSIRLWDAQTGHLLNVLRGHTRRVRSVAFNSDSSMLASASEDQMIRLWDCQTGHCLNILQGHTYGVRSITFNPRYNLLASGADDQTTRMWDAMTGRCLKTLQGHTNAVWAVDFGPNGKLLVSCGEDRSIRLWESATGTCSRSICDARHGVRCIALDPQGRFIASGGEDRSVRLWDVHTGNCLNKFQGHSNWIRSITFNPDGSLLASGGEDQIIRLWDTASGQCLRLLSDHSSWIRSLAFGQDGKLLASAGDDQTIRLWDVASGTCLFILQGHTSQIRSIAFSPDGDILASGGEDRTILLWCVMTGQLIQTLHGHTSWVRSVAFSPDGRTLASSGDDLTIRLWSSHSGQRIHTLHGHTGRIRWVAFSPDGRLLASSSDDSSIKLWDTQNGQCLRTLHSERPYERMDITATQGLTEAQKTTLQVLGAIVQ